MSPQDTDRRFLSELLKPVKSTATSTVTETATSTVTATAVPGGIGSIGSGSPGGEGDDGVLGSIGDFIGNLFGSLGFPAGSVAGSLVVAGSTSESVGSGSLGAGALGSIEGFVGSSSGSLEENGPLGSSGETGSMGPGSSSGSLGGGDAGSLAVGSLGLSALTIGGIIYGINTGAIPLPQIDMPPLPPALGLLLSQQNEVAGRLRKPPVHARKTVEANPHLIDGPSPLGEAGRRRRPPPCGE